MENVKRLCLFGALLLSACDQNTLPCALYVPCPERPNPYWSPAEIKSVNIICNDLNVMDTDRCVLTKNWNSASIQLCRPGTTRRPLTSQMIHDVWTHVEGPLRSCGHGPLADSIQDELHELAKEVGGPSVHETERVYSPHDALDIYNHENHFHTQED
jgi:hypothetical protein